MLFCTVSSCATGRRSSATVPRVADCVASSIPMGNPSRDAVAAAREHPRGDRRLGEDGALRGGCPGPRRYAETRGEADFTLLSEVARVLNEVAHTDDPAVAGRAR